MVCDQGCTEALTIQVDNGEGLSSVRQDKAFPKSLLSSGVTERSRKHKKYKKRKWCRHHSCSSVEKLSKQSAIEPDSIDAINEPKASSPISRGRDGEGEVGAGSPIAFWYHARGGADNLSAYDG